MARERLQLSDLFADPYKIKSPIVLDEATRALYQRAIDSPSSLTDEERRTVTHCPPGPAEAEKCRQTCGLSFAEVVRKSIEQPHSVTYLQARSLLQALIPNDGVLNFRYLVRLSKDDQNLIFAATEAAWTEEMREVRANAHAVTLRGYPARVAATEFFDDEHSRYNRVARMVPWQDQVLLDTESEVCGLVGFYTDREDWAAFRKDIETAVYHAFHFDPEHMRDEVISKFTLHWVPMNNPSDRDLFTEKRDRGEFPRGLRTDCFLFVDQEALQSRYSKRPFVWLWEPKYQNKDKWKGKTEDEEKEEEEDLPALKIDTKHIFPALFARLTQRDLATEEARRRPFRFEPTLKNLHYLTSHWLNKQRDGIWPAGASWM